MTDPIQLRNRFAMAKGAWDEHLRGTPFPSLGEGTAEEKMKAMRAAGIHVVKSPADLGAAVAKLLKVKGH